MVGGKVVEVIPLAEKVWVDTQERIWSPIDQQFHLGSTCAIYVAPTPEAQRIQVGDSLWWQGSAAYWTPTDRTVEDYPIPRIGSSGVPRP